MKTKEFNQIKPYTYFIVRLKDNQKYHGVRVSNIKKKLAPKDDFAVHYFGSSKSSFCKEFKKNPKKFKFRLCWTFDTINNASKYEVKVNKKIYKKIDWENNSAYPLINQTQEVKEKISKAMKGKYVGNKNPFFGKKHTTQSKEKISKKNKGKKISDNHKLKIIISNSTRKITNEFREKCSKINKGRKFPKWVRVKISKGRQGIKLSDEHKKNIGLGVIGIKNGMYGKTHSAKARKKISKSRIGKIPWNKGLKYKTNRAPWNKGLRYKINKKKVA